MSRPKSVLVVMRSGIRKHGSFEDFMLHLAGGARDRGWRIGFVFPAAGAPEVVEELKRKGAEVFFAPAPWDSKDGVAQVIKIIDEFRPGMVNFHFCSDVGQLRVYLHCRLRSIPIVYHYHGEIRPLHTLKWRNRNLSGLRLASFLWNRIITVSHANERFLRALHVAPPIDVVYNGIDVPCFERKSIEAAAQLPPREHGAPVTCIYIGSLIPRKRVDVLIRAFALAEARSPDIRLIVIGEGSLEASLKELAQKLQVAEKVNFTGLLIDYPFKVLKSGDIFVSASESESFGLVFAEAMALSLPVVACNVGGIPEVVSSGTCGLLVSVNDPGKFGDALVTLVQDPELRELMGRAALERVETNFQLRDTIDSTLQVFGRFF